MEKRGLLLLLVFLLNSILINAQSGDWFFNSQSLVIDVNVISGAEIKPKASDYDIDYIKVNLSHYPYESFNQQVIELDIISEADEENNALLFEWENPEEKIDFGYKAKIKTNNNIVEIKEKVPFPIIDLDDDLRRYTQPAEIIDSNNEEIIELASRLVEGEDDMYVAVHKLASWTKNNINYNLSTLTADASQKASWVLDTRQGVCDELTSLFIAMLRSVGIPAKFISGVAYTNSDLFPENWGSHGWAEVYFPGYGWVPYDVTYGQFGYTDPTHIKLREGVDSAEPSVQYKWLSRNINLDTKELDIDADVSEIIGRAKKPISLSVSTLKENVGFGSYNLVEVVLENLEDYYVSSEVYISRPKNLELTENFIRNVLLKPKEEKSVFWTLKLPDDLERNFIYTFPITISTLRNFTKSIDFKSKRDDIVLLFDEVDNILQQKEEEEQKIYSKDVEIDCNIEKEEFYAYEGNLISCNVKNLGNTFLEDLNLCLTKECENFDLGIAQEKSFNFSVENLQAEKQELTLNLKNGDVSKAAYLEIDVLDQPEIEITEIEAPETVEYNDQYKISFLLSKVSRSNPKNVEITLSNKNFEKTWILEELFDNRKFIINLIGKELRKGLNDFNINIEYEDANGRGYEVNENFNVELINVSFVQNIFLGFNALFVNLEDPKAIAFVIISSLIVFAIVVWMVFRKK